MGKSALFNRLVRRREALVHNTPGGHVTRDYQEGRAQLADLRFRVLDTSGLEPFQPSETIQARATQLTARVLARADLALLLVDGRTGVLPADEQLARWLRRAAPTCTVVPVANKCERRGPRGEAAVADVVAEVPRLGFGDVVAISAETGEGMTELYAALQPAIDRLTDARGAAVQQLLGQETGQPAEAGEAGAEEGAEAAGLPTEGAGSTGSGEPSTSGRGTAAAGKDASSSSSRSSSGTAPLKIAIMGLPNVVSPAGCRSHAAAPGGPGWWVGCGWGVGGPLACCTPGWRCCCCCCCSMGSK